MSEDAARAGSENRRVCGPRYFPGHRPHGAVLYRGVHFFPTAISSSPCAGDAPRYPATISLVVKSLKQSSTMAINRCRAATVEFWQPRFFDRALRMLEEYNKTARHLHLNPVRRGLARCPQDWRGPSFNEYAGVPHEEQNQRCGLVIGRVLPPSDERTRI